MGSRWRALSLAGLLLPGILMGGELPNLDQLPAWARAAVKDAATAVPPAEADAWVLLQRQEVAYRGADTVQLRSLRLVRVIRGKGLEEATFWESGLRKEVLRIKTLKGWNLRPDGQLVRLERQDVASFADRGEASFATGMTEVAVLPRVMEGSLIAFEVEMECQGLQDPRLSFGPQGPNPIRLWELAYAVKDPLFGTLKGVRTEVSQRGFGPWLPAPEAGPERLFRARQVPALPVGEAATPHAFRRLPSVEVRFIDPQWQGAQALASWDAFGTWCQGIFAPRIDAGPEGDPAVGSGLQGLRTLWGWWGQSMTYKQVYRSPDRDFVPESAANVALKRYGDCKDLACLFIALARRGGFQGFPVLARIQLDPIEAAELSAPPVDRFNHAIVALRLEQSLGLAAEVATPRGRFLLVDPTDPYTPLGQLGSSHRGGRLLICCKDGGQWVQVPEAAILHGAMAITLTGQAQPGGDLDCQAALLETGDLWGLRAQAHRLSALNFRQYVESRFIDQAPNGKVEILAMGDPLDLTQPFTVRLHLNKPQGWAPQGRDWVLKPSLGLPSLPAPLTRFGQARRQPIEVWAEDQVTLKGSIDLPFLVRPLVPARQGQSAFRSLSWTVGVLPAPAGCRLTFELEERRKDAFFGMEQLDQGVAAWKQDRALVRALLEDGMAFR